MLHSEHGEILRALDTLEITLMKRGVRLSRKDDEACLVTAPETSQTIELLAKEELSQEIGKAGLETMTIVLYRGPIARSQIDYIRGVNSTFTLRNLLIRGLIERIPNPKDSRGFLYRPTFDLMNHLGITRIENLPEYAKVVTETQTEEEIQ